MKNKLHILVLALASCAGCATVSDKQAELMAQTAQAYYNQPKVANLWTLTAKDGKGRIVFEGFDSFTMNTPVPPISIMPKDPSTMSVIADTIKTAVPYAAGAYLLKDTIGKGNTTINNAAAQ